MHSERSQAKHLPEFIVNELLCLCLQTAHLPPDSTAINGPKLEDQQYGVILQAVLRRGFYRDGMREPNGGLATGERNDGDNGHCALSVIIMNDQCRTLPGLFMAYRNRKVNPDDVAARHALFGLLDLALKDL